MAIAKRSPEPPTSPAPAPKAPYWHCFTGTLQFRDRVYGGLPRNEHMFDAWQKAKAFPPEIAQENREDVGELEESVEAGETVFRRDATGLHLREFQLKAACKEATQRLGLYQKLKRNEDQLGLRSWQQTGFYCLPKRLYLVRDGTHVMEPDGSEEAQGRVPTPKGPKSILRKSEYVERASCTFQLRMLPFKGFGLDELTAVLALAQEIGLGSWRSHGGGTFDVIEFRQLDDQPLTLGSLEA